MNRLMTAVSVIAAVTVGLATASLIENDDAVVTADKAAMAAFDKGDKATLARYLDRNFSWIDTDGNLFTKEDVLAGGLRPLVGEGTGVDIIEHSYGEQVAWLQAHSKKNYVVRFWEKRPAGWKLVHTTEIASPSEERVQVPFKYAIPCINPCTELPMRLFHQSEEVLQSQQLRLYGASCDPIGPAQWR